jgi:Domain of unknown function (DUF4939)
MAQPIPTNGSKELNLNKPNTFNGDRKGFKKFLQDVEVYMDVNHETYNNNLRKIAFVLSFMTTGSAATWKAQFVDEAYNKSAPANPNDRLCQGFTKSHSGWVRMDSDHGDLKNILMTILPRTTSDPSWEASAW